MKHPAQGACDYADGEGFPAPQPPGHLVKARVPAHSPGTAQKECRAEFTARAVPTECVCLPTKTKPHCFLTGDTELSVAAEWEVAGQAGGLLHTT